jgi:hypothetical protein
MLFATFLCVLCFAAGLTCGAYGVYRMQNMKKVDAKC